MMMMLSEAEEVYVKTIIRVIMTIKKEEGEKSAKRVSFIYLKTEEPKKKSLCFRINSKCKAARNLIFKF